MTKKEIKSVIAQLESMVADAKEYNAVYKAEDFEKAEQIYKEVSEVVDTMRSIVEIFQEELQDKFDNISERAQEGARGEELEDDIDLCETIMDDLDEFIDDDEEMNLKSLKHAINCLKGLL